jgi:predicted nucleotidyltransferase
MTMTNEALIDEAKVIVFGSRARGEGGPDSDLDLLVIEPDFARRGEEYGMLRRELRGLGVAINLVVYRGRELDEWGGESGGFLHQALAEGRVLQGA